MSRQLALLPPEPTATYDELRRAWDSLPPLCSATFDRAIQSPLVRRCLERVVQQQRKQKVKHYAR